MKKIIAFAMPVLMLFTLVGCGSSNKFNIDSDIWTMTTIQSIKNEGTVVAYEQDNSSSDKAVKIDMECSGEKGKLTQ